MKRLLGLLLVLGMVGYGSRDSAVDAPVIEVDAPAIENRRNNSQELAADTVEESTTDDPVAALEKLGAKIKRNEQGEVYAVDLADTRITDAGMVHLAGLNNLMELNFRYTQITENGVSKLREALPNCEIRH